MASSFLNCPAADWPDRAVVAVDLARVAAVIDRIAADVDELARARRVQDLDTAAVLPDPRAERRRRLAEPDLEFRAFCARLRLPASSTPQLERAWDAWQAERYQRGEISQRPGYTDNPSGHANDPPRATASPGQFRKLDAITVLTGPLLPAPRRVSQALRARSVRTGPPPLDLARFDAELLCQLAASCRASWRSAWL